MENNFWKKAWDVAIIIATIILVIINIAANIIAYRDGIGWLGWLIGDVILAFVDFMFVKGLIKRFGKKKEEEK